MTPFVSDETLISPLVWRRLRRPYVSSRRPRDETHGRTLRSTGSFTLPPLAIPPPSLEISSERVETTKILPSLTPEERTLHLIHLWGRRTRVRRYQDKMNRVIAARAQREADRHRREILFSLLPPLGTLLFSHNFERELDHLIREGLSQGRVLEKELDASPPLSLHEDETVLRLKSKEDTFFSRLRRVAVARCPHAEEADLHAVMASIFYTTDIGYKAINPMLRSRTHYGSGCVLKALYHFIHRHAVVDTTLVRSTCLPPIVVSQLEATDLLGDMAFISTSPLETGVPPAFRHATDRLIILRGHGTNVSHVSMYPTEAEILILPGATFSLIGSFRYWGHAYNEKGDRIDNSTRVRRTVYFLRQL